MQWNRALILSVALAVPMALNADTLTLKAGHPERYVVKKGDTLWDISGRFLEQPWRWPEIWKVNPQIRNPDLIYPGDEVLITYQGGKPTLALRRGGHPTVRLSPRVREQRLAGEAVPTIPIDVISPFLSRARVVTEDQYQNAPYIVSLGKEALMGRAGQSAYVRGPVDPDVKRYVIYRKGQPYVDPGADGEVLGYEAVHIADAVFEAPGDPATFVVSGSKREVLAGDRLLPVDERQIDRNFMPQAPRQQVEGSIISVVDGVSQIGQYNVVVINRGRRDGIDVGDVLAVYQRGETVNDPFAKPPVEKAEPPSQIELDPAKQGGVEGFAKAATDLVMVVQDKLGKLAESVQPKPYQTVTLPDVRAGTVLVFRPFERMSYALVMKATRAMHVEDRVRNP